MSRRSGAYWTCQQHDGDIWPEEEIPDDVNNQILVNNLMIQKEAEPIMEQEKLDSKELMREISSGPGQNGPSNNLQIQTDTFSRNLVSLKNRMIRNIPDRVIGVPKFYQHLDQNVKTKDCDIHYGTICLKEEADDRIVNSKLRERYVHIHGQVEDRFNMSEEMFFKLFKNCLKKVNFHMSAEFSESQEPSHNIAKLDASNLLSIYYGKNEPPGTGPLKGFLPILFKTTTVANLCEVAREHEYGILSCKEVYKHLLQSCTFQAPPSQVQPTTPFKIRFKKFIFAGQKHQKKKDKKRYFPHYRDTRIARENNKSKREIKALRNDLSKEVDHEPIIARLDANATSTANVASQDVIVHRDSVKRKTASVSNKGMSAKKAYVTDAWTTRMIETFLWIGDVETTLLGAGFGAVAKRDIKKGEIVGEYTGEQITDDEADRRGQVYHYGTSYVYHLTYAIGALDSAKAGNETRFINHSNTPNLTTIFRMSKGEPRVGFVADQDIRKDEEVFFPYGYSEETLKFLFSTKPGERNDHMQYESSTGETREKDTRTIAAPSTSSYNQPGPYSSADQTSSSRKRGPSDLSGPSSPAKKRK
ncbi:hypothetical protein L5515_016729 [Caenorhabditis briggsae]|nr:hypothetical protein L5515_016729 [Caenorhabditis briggsae]